MTDSCGQWTLKDDHPLQEVSDHSSDEDDANSDDDNDCLTDGTEDNQELTEEVRAGSLFWCKCGECQLTSEIESFCCQESGLIRKHIPADKNCVITAPLFEQIILCKDGLEFARQLIGNAIPSPEKREEYFGVILDNKKYRNLAYNSFFL